MFSSIDLLVIVGPLSTWESFVNRIQDLVHQHNLQTPEYFNVMGPVNFQEEMKAYCKLDYHKQTSGRKESLVGLMLQIEDKDEHVLSYSVFLCKEFHQVWNSLLKAPDSVKEVDSKVICSSTCSSHSDEP